MQELPSNPPGLRVFQQHALQGRQEQQLQAMHEEKEPGTETTLERTTNKPRATSGETLPALLSDLPDSLLLSYPWYKGRLRQHV